MSAHQFQVIVGGKPKRLDSAASTVDFQSVRIGAGLLEILENAGHFAFSNKRLTGVADPLNASDAANKNYVDMQVAALGTAAEWMNSVLAVLTDPPAEPNEGDRYLIGLDTAAELATGDWTGQDGKVAEYKNGAWEFVLPTPGSFISADNEASSIFYFGGADWVQKYFEATTASNGLMKVGFDVQVKFESSVPSLALFGAGELGVKLSPTSALEKTADGITIKLEASNPTLEKTGNNELAVKIGAASGLEKTAAGLNIKLEATNPSLQKAGNELGIKFDPAGALSKTSAGVKANVGEGLEIDANAIKAKLADSTLQVSEDGLAVDFTENFENDEVAQMTIGQVAYLSANGKAKLAAVSETLLNPGTQFLMLAIATLASGAVGKYYAKAGAKIAGFTGLVPNSPVYLSKTTPGALVQDLTGFAAGDAVVRVGFALSTTELKFDPAYLYEN